ncbi:hypothetical protein GCM10009747_19650 [Agromyces humatus]|uniref:Uncharacterized protein n=1 Tax=Agromyces humatus TaxID=279573 RepID=A0ABN2KN57_9MICO
MPAVMAVPTDVAGVSRSVVMPAIDTVNAFTANDAWICVSTTTMSGSHEVADGLSFDAVSVGAAAVTPRPLSRGVAKTAPSRHPLALTVLPRRA